MLDKDGIYSTPLNSPEHLENAEIFLCNIPKKYQKKSQMIRGGDKIEKRKKFRRMSVIGGRDKKNV